ncbi:MAG: hypothetical protein J7623_21160 [Chitinophaga sp.]|uniref:hypothetical protein n=1 Tax=Chitinophaga sp. TaxID=1869181 RepID=UPI001B167833|nr:hypothetical protein [Chitinophaga sp.]MBO9731161.1 hypothetical protein [Chitinophaga sp.]
MNKKQGFESWKKYLLVGGAVYVIYKVFAGIRSAGNAVSSIAEMEAIAKQSNVSSERIAVCKDVAEKCEKAIWNYHPMFGVIPIMDYSIGEDEGAVIQNLNRLNTVQEAALTSQFYAQKARGHSLLADVRKYLNADEQAQINTTVINSIS